jgi:hypothetical protein
MMMEGSGGRGNPMRTSNERPALAGVVNAVAIPMTATPNRTFVFICARIDGALGWNFTNRPLKEAELPSACSIE